MAGLLDFLMPSQANAAEGSANAQAPMQQGLGPNAALGTQVVKMILNLIREMFGDDPDKVEEDFFAWVEENFGDNAERFARSGAMGLITGVDMSGSANPIPNIPRSGIDLLGAPTSAVLGVAEGIAGMLGPDKMRAIEKLVPSGAVAAPMRALREYREGVTTRRGTPYYWQGEPLQPTAYETLLRSFNFQPSRLNEAKAEVWNEREREERLRKQKSSLNQRYRDLSRTPRESRSEKEAQSLLSDIVAYNQMAREHGGSEITRQSLNQAAQSTYGQKKKR
jgi:hypothetical protein